MCMSLLLSCTFHMNNLGEVPLSVDNLLFSVQLSTSLYSSFFQKPLDQAFRHKTHHAKSQS